jgi:hypothetical protein
MLHLLPFFDLGLLSPLDAGLLVDLKPRPTWGYVRTHFFSKHDGNIPYHGIITVFRL